MRPVRKITAEEENFRIELLPRGFSVIRREPIEPEPVGAIVLCAFKITGYDRDCDGSLMARLSQIGKDGEETGWSQDSIGLSHDTDLVCTLEEFQGLFDEGAISNEETLT